MGEFSPVEGEPTLEHVGVSMSIYLGRVLRPGEVIEVDNDELLSTLVELGEFHHTFQPSDIQIKLVTNLSLRQGVSGFAVPASKEVPFRAVTSELFSARRTNSITKYKHDSEGANRLLLHELKHAVDFQNTAVYNDHQKYKRRDALKRDAIYGAGALVAAAASILPDTNIFTGENIGMKILDGGITAFGLWSIARLRNLQLRFGHGYTSGRKYLKAPLEARAYSLTDEYDAQKRLPSIVKFYTVS